MSKYQTIIEFSETFGCPRCKNNRYCDKQVINWKPSLCHILYGAIDNGKYLKQIIQGRIMVQKIISTRSVEEVSAIVAIFKIEYPNYNRPFIIRGIEEYDMGNT